jgi:hypothetical protein
MIFWRYYGLLRYFGDIIDYYDILDIKNDILEILWIIMIF